MHCSIRFYADPVSSLPDTRNALNLLDNFSRILGQSYDFVSHILFDPDNDDPIIDKKYRNSVSGRKLFEDSDILYMYLGRDGEESAPIISAFCNGVEKELYSKIHIRLIYPQNTLPLMICVDYEQRSTIKMTTDIYSALLQSLFEQGIIVNNGFYHVYIGKNHATTLDGGQIGSFISYTGLQNAHNFVLHRKNACLNRLMGIYCINSIYVDCLDKDTMNAITHIVGNNNVSLSNNIFSFTLGNKDCFSPLYRIKSRKKIKELNLLLST